MRTKAGRVFQTLALTLVALSPLALVAGGCGASSATPNSNPADAAPPKSDASDDVPAIPSDAGAVTVVAADVTVYVSQVAKLDASQTQGPAPGDTVSFTWTVTTAPTGSTITTASLQNASTATPSLTPDVAGDFVLGVKATSGGQSATRTVTVHASNGFVFYTTTKADNTAPYLEFDVVQMDGTGAHAVACRQQTFALPPNAADAGSLNFADAGADSGLAGAFLAISTFSADFDLDTWEGEAGTPGRAAFQVGTYPLDAGAAAIFSLVAATSDNTCQTPPTPVHAVTGSQPSIFQPRFSPDGTRVAYLEQRDQNTMHVASIGFDGTDYHDFGDICGPDAGLVCLGSDITGTRPQWLDATHLGWMIQTNTSGAVPANWAIMTAPDTNNPASTTYMTCTGGVTPRGFAFLKDGSVVANYMAPTGLVEDLVVFAAPTGGTGTCTMSRNLTNLTNPQSYARDFSISPDGSMIAYVQYTTPPGGIDASNLILEGGSLYVVPVDGSAPPHAVGGGADLHAFFGPRWIAGGTRLAWNGTAALPDASASTLDASLALFEGGAPAMNVIPIAGSTLFHAAQSDVSNGVFVFGGGNGGGCSFNLMLCRASPLMAGSTGGAIALSGLFGLAFVMRRRNRKARQTSKKS